MKYGDRVELTERARLPRLRKVDGGGFEIDDLTLEPGSRGVVASHGFSLFYTYVKFADGNEGPVPAISLEVIE